MQRVLSSESMPDWKDNSESKQDRVEKYGNDTDFGFATPEEFDAQAQGDLAVCNMMQPRTIEHYRDKSPMSKEDDLYVHDKVYVKTPPAEESHYASSPDLDAVFLQNEALVTTSIENAVGSEKTNALRREAKNMQDGLAAILDRIHDVKDEYEKLEDENKFLQDYIGNLMSKSKMLTTKFSDL
ncbi:hypothetical protein V1512DRAFT_265834 [Lipomyces arxii]|uniref:uncharacterized protein n=1 Tax=Lipomyces arxii TaxID=56418 RepID=UPI0034CFD751